MAAFRDLREEVRKTDEKRDQQHRELLDLIKGLQGSRPTPQARSSGPSFEDPPEDDHDHDFSPRDESGSHQDGADPQSGREQQRSGLTPREDVTSGTGAAGTAPMEIEPVPQVDQVVSLQRTPLLDPTPAQLSTQSTGVEFHSRGPHIGSTPAELTPAVDLLGASSPHTPAADLMGTSSQHTPADHPRGPSSSVQHTPTRDTLGHASSSQCSDSDQTPPPVGRQARGRKPGWQQRTPYTDSCRPKRPRMMPPPPHVWAPNALVDGEHLQTYLAYKKNSTGEL